MTLLVTIGATQEPLDAMRILSNRSTGELGTRLALTLVDLGHRVIALRSTGATAKLSPLRERGIEILPFTTTEELRSLLEQTAVSEKVDAIFHAAAVSDFYFPGAGAGKIPTGNGPLTLTLEPTPKILPLLRDWYPQAQIIGWKFEASGDQATALRTAKASASSKSRESFSISPTARPSAPFLARKSAAIFPISKRAFRARLIHTNE